MGRLLLKSGSSLWRLLTAGFVISRELAGSVRLDVRYAGSDSSKLRLGERSGAATLAFPGSMRSVRTYGRRPGPPIRCHEGKGTWAVAVDVPWCWVKMASHDHDGGVRQR